MNIDNAYEYINDIRNPLPTELKLQGLNKPEALKIIAIVKWLRDFEASGEGTE